jgi:hypothetical protein
MHSIRRALAAALLTGFLTLPACGGGDDAPLLTAQAAEPAGDHCARGGQALRIGHDDDGDGTLDDAEVEDTRYVCDVAHPLLVRSDAEPAGEHCASGGTAVRSGIDDDGDGQLADAEIDATTYVCGRTEIWDGDFADWSDPVKVAQLHEARVVTGSLTIGTDLAVELPQLEVVGGTLSIVGTGIEPVELPALRQVGALLTNEHLIAPLLADVAGDLGYSGNDEKGFRLPGLTRIGGNLEASTADGALVLGALETIGGTLHLGAIPGLVALHADALASVGGDVSAVFTHLVRLELPALARVGGDIRLDSNNDAEAVLLPALTEVVGIIDISTMPKVSTVDLGHLARFPRLLLSFLPLLHTLDLSRLDGGRVVVDHVGLAELELPVFGDGSDLQVSDCPLLRALTLPQVDRVSTMYILRNPRLESLTAGGMEVAQFIELEDLPALTRLDMPYLREVSSLNLVRVGLTEVPGLSGLETARYLGFQAMDHLSSLAGLGALSSVRRLDLHLDPVLLDLHGLEGLTEIPDVLDISGMGLTSLHGLENLRHAGNLRVYFTPVTDLAGLSGLRSIAGALLLDELSGLTSLTGLDGLRSVSGAITIAHTRVPAPQIDAFEARVAP